MLNNICNRTVCSQSPLSSLNWSLGRWGMRGRGRANIFNFTSKNYLQIPTNSTLFPKRKPQFDWEEEASCLFFQKRGSLWGKRRRFTKFILQNSSVFCNILAKTFFAKKCNKSFLLLIIPSRRSPDPLALGFMIPME